LGKKESSLLPIPNQYAQMSKRIAVLFAGQGAQAVGMGKDLSERYPAAKDLFQRADEIVERPLSRIMFEGPEEELTETVNCQPALFVHGFVCFQALVNETGGLPIHAAAGLSLGEFTAHSAAGTFDFETGLRLVAKRAQFMQEACEETSGTMAAIIGADENAVRELAAETDVDIANLNAPGQVVISGEASKIALAISMAKKRGARRATELNVAGAYHSRLMQPAYLKLSAELHLTKVNQPRFPVICNVDARPVSGPDEIRRSLQEQVTGTVRWSESMEYLIDEMKCDQFVEIGPGGVLAGLLKRMRKDVPVVAVSDVLSLEAAVQALR
jgi:[acyl-carrier-protein] S-malonyltransferase